MNGRVWTLDDVRALGLRTDIVTAGEILGMGRTKSHELARRGEFPVPVLRHGSRYVVATAHLLRALACEPEHSGSADLSATTTTSSTPGQQNADSMQEPAPPRSPRPGDPHHGRTQPEPHATVVRLPHR